MISRHVKKDVNLPKSFDFKSYTPDELKKIFYLHCDRRNLKVDIRLDRYISAIFKNLKAKSDPLNFGNGREVRNFLDRLMIEINNRIANTGDISKIKTETFSKIIKIDLTNAAQYYNLFNKLQTL